MRVVMVVATRPRMAVGMGMGMDFWVGLVQIFLDEIDYGGFVVLADVQGVSDIVRTRGVVIGQPEESVGILLPWHLDEGIITRATVASCSSGHGEQDEECASEPEEMSMSWRPPPATSNTKVKIDLKQLDVMDRQTVDEGKLQGALDFLSQTGADGLRIRIRSQQFNNDDLSLQEVSETANASMLSERYKRVEKDAWKNCREIFDYQ